MREWTKEGRTEEHWREAGAMLSVPPPVSFTASGNMPAGGV